jgi:RNA polymerase primary sigma factor
MSFRKAASTELGPFRERLLTHQNLTKEEVRALHHTYRTHPEEGVRRRARDTVILRHMRFVASLIAQHPDHYGMTYGELMNEGCCGLMLAFERFQPGLGYAFTTYAAFWVRLQLTIAFIERSYNRPIKFPDHMSSKLRAIQRIRQQLFALGDEPIDASELAPLLQQAGHGMHKKTIDTLLNLSREGSFHSLDDPAEQHLNATLEADARPDDTVEIRQLVERQKDALRILKPQESDIIRSRYGLGKEPETLQKIGDRYGVSRERIRQIEQVALRKLRGQYERRSRKYAA